MRRKTKTAPVRQDQAAAQIFYAGGVVKSKGADLLGVRTLLTFEGQSCFC